MKKLFLLIIVTILTMGMLSAAIITVTNPHSGDIWVKGKSYNITWTKYGSMDANVKIRLYNPAGTNKILDITNSTANDGNFTWPVPNTVANGSYVVRVKTLDNLTWDDGDVFSIANAPMPAASITVSKPASGETVTKGSPYTIKWTKSGAQDASVKIRLYNPAGTTKILDITNSTANDGSFSWPVPNNVAVGNFIVRVKTLDNNVFNDSDVFKVKAQFTHHSIDLAQLTDMSIKIIKPSSSSFWKGGTKHDIIWENKNAKNKKLKIDLYSYDGKDFIKNIYTKNYLYTNPNSTTSKYSWTVPDIGPKKCKIKISIIDGIGKGTSDMFTLTIPTKIKKYKIFGTTYNKVKWRKQERYGNSNPVYYETPTVGDPGPGKMRFGSESFNNKTSDSSYLYRSYVFFDVSQLKGKGVILKAKLHYTVYKTTGNCGISKGNVHIVDEAWESKMFTCSLTTIYQSTNLTPFITKWVANSESNFGFAVLAKEADHYLIWGQDTKCFSYAKDVYLEIEILEK